MKWDGRKTRPTSAFGAECGMGTKTKKERSTQRSKEAKIRKEGTIQRKEAKKQSFAKGIMEAFGQWPGIGDRESGGGRVTHDSGEWTEKGRRRRRRSTQRSKEAKFRKEGTIQRKEAKKQSFTKKERFNAKKQRSKGSQRINKGGITREACVNGIPASGLIGLMLVAENRKRCETRNQ